jgi:hypothetical protein
LEAEMKLGDVAVIIGMVGGITGTILGIYNTVIQRRNSRPRLKVIMEAKFLVVGAINSEPLICIEVQNVGDKPVRLFYPRLLIKEHRSQIMLDPTFAQSNVEFPKDLEPGQSFTTMVEKRVLGQSMKLQGSTGKIRIRPIVTDGINRLYKGKHMVFDIDEAVKIERQAPFPLFRQRDELMKRAFELVGKPPIDE